MMNLLYINSNFRREERDTFRESVQKRLPLALQLYQ
jgi:hypothetical protein